MSQMKFLKETGQIDATTAYEALEDLKYQM